MLIIFDLDDTLIDTTEKLTPIIFKNILKLMKAKGLELKNEKLAYRQLLEIDKKSLSSKESLKKFLDGLKAKKNFYNIAVKFIKHPSFESYKVFPIKDAKKILKYLSKNHTLALVSRGKKEFQFDKIQKAGIDTAIFSKIVVTPRGNKGYYYKKIIEQLNFSYQNTYVCGDNVDLDLLPAKKIGCKTIRMNYGRGKFLSEDKNVDYSINFLEEIKEIIEKNKERKICR